MHAEWTQPEELADLDREIAEADPEEAMGLRRKRIVWREQHLEPDTSPARVALDHAEDVLLVHLRSGSNAFRRLWTWPLVVARGTPNHSRLGSHFGPMECGRNGHAGSRD